MIARKSNLAILLSVLCLGSVLDLVVAKPTSQGEESQPASISQPIESPTLSSSPSASVPSSPNHAEPRRVVSSWNEDGMWQGSARLPSSSQSGGNEHSSSKPDLTNGRTSDTDNNDINSGRINRRLHKWEKTDELSDETETYNEDGDGTQLAQSLSAMASHLLDKADESLENSSERDVYISKDEDSTSTDNNDTDETSSDEESDQGQENSATTDPKTTSISTWHDEMEEGSDDDKMADKQKSDASPTTPKGLTTWSAVNGGSGSNFVKGTVQKLPSDYTISSALSFSTDRPATTIDMIVTKDRSTFPTTEMPRTTKANNAATTMNIKRRKPYNKNKKVVLPSKFVKPQLEEVTAEAIGTDATHTIYKTKVTVPETKTMAPSTGYNPYTTKKPLWPYQMTTRRIPTKRPAPFSRITAKPKNPNANNKRPNIPNLTLNTPTTTTPSSTTTYLRNPAPLMYPFPSISFTNLGFMDFLRSQIIPRIGLSLISFMAASPLILSMLGASAVGRRRKRDVSFKTDKVAFESVGKLEHLPKFDFSTIKRKLQKLEMSNKKKVSDRNSTKSILSTFTQILTQLLDSQAFSALKAKLLKPENKDATSNKNQLKFKSS